MSRYIDAHDLQKEYMATHDGKRLLLIDVAPTIEPEREKGKWTYIDEAMFGNPHGSYKCSVCDNRMPYKTNFCQRCGADMRGEQE